MINHNSFETFLFLLSYDFGLLLKNLSHMPLINGHLVSSSSIHDMNSFEKSSINCVYVV